MQLVVADLHLSPWEVKTDEKPNMEIDRGNGEKVKEVASSIAAHQAKEEVAPLVMLTSGHTDWLV